MTSVQVRYHAAMPNSTICYQQIRLMLVSSQESRVGKKRDMLGHLGTYVGPLIPRLIRAADSCGLASREIESGQGCSHSFRRPNAYSARKVYRGLHQLSALSLNSFRYGEDAHQLVLFQAGSWRAPSRRSCRPQAPC